MSQNYNLYESLSLNPQASTEELGAELSARRNQESARGAQANIALLDELSVAERILGSQYRRAIYDARLADTTGPALGISGLRSIAAEEEPAGANDVTEVFSAPRGQATRQGDLPQGQEPYYAGQVTQQPSAPQLSDSQFNEQQFNQQLSQQPAQFESSQQNFQAAPVYGEVDYQNSGSAPVPSDENVEAQPTEIPRSQKPSFFEMERSNPGSASTYTTSAQNDRPFPGNYPSADYSAPEYNAPSVQAPAFAQEEQKSSPLGVAAVAGAGVAAGGAALAASKEEKKEDSQEKKSLKPSFFETQGSKSTPQVSVSEGASVSPVVSTTPVSVPQVVAGRQPLEKNEATILGLGAAAWVIVNVIIFIVTMVHVNSIVEDYQTDIALTQQGFLQGIFNAIIANAVVLGVTAFVWVLNRKKQ